MPILSERADGMGFHYGWHRMHRIDVARSHGYRRFKVYVDGEYVGEAEGSLEEAERVGANFIDVILEPPTRSVG